ncbi:MAG: AAA family ATPase, partial [Chlamydiia bacterium]|nr:AAA family ATPase [Chlamydiia bacterium]
ELLEKLFASKKAEFLAIYGRRRVGKTYLVRKFFKNKGIFFEVTGAFNIKTSEQLANFHAEYLGLFNHQNHSRPPKTWREAMLRLKDAIKQIDESQKIVLFFDELPWLASPRSGFMGALDYIWNRHFSEMPNVLLIVSGSAASWMINHVINNTGGLYGRLSAHMRLLPFSLAETEKYLHAHDIFLSRKQVCELYMVTGGIPKYLSYIEKDLSAMQNIHRLCFTPQSPLLIEFHKLYYSLFQNAETHLQVIRILAEKKRGMARGDLINKMQIGNNGNITAVLRELEESGFIASFPEIGKKAKGTQYYLNDEYTLFYLKWIDPHKGTLLRGVEEDYWIKRESDPSWKSWAGFAFENLCLKHVPQIKKALQIGGVTTSSGYWKATSQGKKEVEVDLVIERADQCTNLCEIKFSKGEFTLTKSYAEELLRKKRLFAEKTKATNALFITMITPFGVNKNTHYLSTINQQITLDALFDESFSA